SRDGDDIGVQYSAIGVCSQIPSRAAPPYASQSEESSNGSPHPTACVAAFNQFESVAPESIFFQHGRVCASLFNWLSALSAIDTNQKHALFNGARSIYKHTAIFHDLCEYSEPYRVRLPRQAHRELHCTCVSSQVDRR
ncbi:unnamed protein product, partial [Mycena citricolor]